MGLRPMEKVGALATTKKCAIPVVLNVALLPIVDTFPWELPAELAWAGASKEVVRHMESLRLVIRHKQQPHGVFWVSHVA